MKRATRLLPLASLLVLFPLLQGCGGNVTTSSGTNPAANTNPTPTVTVAISESYVSLGAKEGHQFTATVTGTDNTAVTWSVTGCTDAACGSITSTGHYTAPSQIPAAADVKVVATAQADRTKSDTATVHHAPITVSVDPMSTWVSPGGSLEFTATVLHDLTNGGVTWSLTCSNAMCGTLSDVTLGSVLYTAPAKFPDPSRIMLTGTSVADPSKAVQVVITASSTDTLAEGDYAFVFSGWQVDLSGGWYWPFRFAAAGHFRADGKGNILDGVEDINSIGGVSQSVPFIGSYGVGSDRRGVLTIVAAGQTTTYHMVLEPSGTRAKFIRYDRSPSDSPISAAGYLELQDKAAFPLSSLSGDYAMGMSGAGAGHSWGRIATAGRFTLGSDGVMASGKLDRMGLVFNGQGLSDISGTLVLTGSLAAPSNVTGRGTATLAVSAARDQPPQNLNLVYYVVSNEKLLLVQTDPRSAEGAGSVLSGEARRQHGTFSAASFNGPAIFSLAGLNREGYGAYFERIALGQMVADGSASLSGVIDDNGYPDPAVVNQPFHGTYTVASDGRSTLQLGAGYLEQAVAYFYGPDQAFLMETRPGTDVMFGGITPQAPGSFDPGTIAGTFLSVTAPPTSEESESECGLTTFDGESGAISSIDTSENLSDDPQFWLGEYELTGTYDVASNGRGTLTFPSQSRTVVFWLISPTEMVANAAMSSDGWYYIDWAALLEFTR